jgi:hypothetical protein
MPEVINDFTTKLIVKELRKTLDAIKGGERLSRDKLLDITRVETLCRMIRRLELNNVEWEGEEREHKKMLEEMRKVIGDEKQRQFVEFVEEAEPYWFE